MKTMMGTMMRTPTTATTTTTRMMSKKGIEQWNGTHWAEPGTPPSPPTLAKRVSAILLPRNFPSSVSPNYIPYSAWHGAHVVAGTMTGVLSMQGLLFAVGLGSGSIPLAGALNFVIKDGIGQLGGVLYAAFSSRSLDAQPKYHRFSSTLLLQVSTAIEVLAPLVPGAFLPMASLANVGKNIAYLATGASRAQLNRAFAISHNLGDITGKATSQGIAASLLGTSAGVALSSAIGSDATWVAFSAFVPLSALTVYAALKSSSYAILNTFDRQRLDLALAPAIAASSLSHLAPPRAVADQESFTRMYHGDPGLVLDPPITPGMLPPQAPQALQALESDNFLLLPSHGLSSSAATTTNLWFSQSATSLDVIRGYAVAAATRAGNTSFAQSLLSTSRESFAQSLSSLGWDVDHQYIADPSSHRIRLSSDVSE